MRTQTLIIGAGQAGLALSHCLAERGHEHAILERGRVAERWHSQRHDSFRLLTPNWANRLPGTRAPDDPDAFMGKEEVIDFFTSYARDIAAPVHTGVAVTQVRPAGDGTWEVATDRGIHRATNVVVATGHMDRPATPALARDVPGDILQLHSSQYRNPDQLPDGRVVVVGAGPSGQQVADELARHGREVTIAAGRHVSLPRHYRGRDVYWWMRQLGLLDRTVDSLPDPAAAARLSRSSVLEGGTDDLDLYRLHRNGVTPTGRVLGVVDATMLLGDTLAEDLGAANANADRLRTLVDDHVRRTGMWAPPGTTPPRTGVPTWAQEAPSTIDLRAEGVGSVIWATGYRRDWSWIQAPVFDEHGEPVHRRGITAVPGLSFLGLRWLYRRDSGFIGGVGRDAAHLAAHLAGDRVPVTA